MKRKIIGNLIAWSPFILVFVLGLFHDWKKTLLTFSIPVVVFVVFFLMAWGTQIAEGKDK